MSGVRAQHRKVGDDRHARFDHGRPLETTQAKRSDSKCKNRGLKNVKNNKDSRCGSPKRAAVDQKRLCKRRFSDAVQLGTSRKPLAQIGLLPRQPTIRSRARQGTASSADRSQAVGRCPSLLLRASLISIVPARDNGNKQQRAGAVRGAEPSPCPFSARRTLQNCRPSGRQGQLASTSGTTP
jgi:hypothetical protein